ncbi:MAG: 50S ribosomal protein L3 N(5)-glutamine methyltransferase [Pseudomonadota bacterium]
MTSATGAGRLCELRNYAAAIEVLAGEFDAAGLFFGHGTDRAEDEAAWLVAAQLGIDYADQDWPRDFEQALASPVSRSVAENLSRIARERIRTRRPLAYLLGEAWFAGLRFYVDDNVLVPRSPVAELIAQSYQPWVDPARVTRVLDLCTGSGCIAIASAVALPNATVDASDVSALALDVAARNVALHEMASRVRLIESDLFADPAVGEYDLIVSNPPYVDAAQMRARAPEFQREPELGLAAGDDGLDLVRIILAQAAGHLRDEGVLIVEVGVSDEALQSLYAEVPFTWLEFAGDAGGVFVMSKTELLAYQAVFDARREANPRGR